MRFIYTISCSLTNNVFYVGVTADPKRRKMTHFSSRKSEVGKWIQACVSSGNLPVFNIVEEISGGDYMEAEATWIHKMEKEGHALLNKAKMAGTKPIHIPEPRFRHYKSIKKMFDKHIAIEGSSKKAVIELICKKHMLNYYTVFRIIKTFNEPDYKPLFQRMQATLSMRRK